MKKINVIVTLIYLLVLTQVIFAKDKLCNTFDPIALQIQELHKNLLYKGNNIEPIEIPHKTLNAWLNWPKDNSIMQFAIVIIHEEPNNKNPNSLEIAKERGEWLLKHLIKKGASKDAYIINYKIGEIAQAYVEGVGLKEKK